MSPAVSDPTPHPSPLPAGSRARIVAVVRPFRLDEVMEQLHLQGCRDVLVEQVRGYGRQKENLSIYEGHGFGGSFLPKVRLEFTVDGPALPGAMQAVCRGARTGRIGDGKIFVHRLDPVRPRGPGAPSASGAPPVFAPQHPSPPSPRP
ncbi:MAG: hypothetical protein DHS20C15_17510 [Planctomycetota bacterium]|nr:MAG: hypothetical protein DHS20C15_17510 [Planctomycetota bacterium]